MVEGDIRIYQFSLHLPFLGVLVVVEEEREGHQGIV